MSDDDDGEMQSARSPKDVYDVIALKEEEKLKEAARRREAEGRRPSSGGRTSWGDSSFNEVGTGHSLMGGLSTRESARYTCGAASYALLTCPAESPSLKLAMPSSPSRPASHPPSCCPVMCWICLACKRGGAWWSCRSTGAATVPPCYWTRRQVRGAHQGQGGGAAGAPGRQWHPPAAGQGDR